jgi:hypothetical protein
MWQIEAARARAARTDPRAGATSRHAKQIRPIEPVCAAMVTRDITLAYGNLRKIRDAFVPPNPKEFDIAYSISAGERELSAAMRDTPGL